MDRIWPGTGNYQPQLREEEEEEAQAAQLRAESPCESHSTSQPLRTQLQNIYNRPAMLQGQEQEQREGSLWKCFAYIIVARKKGNLARLDYLSRKLNSLIYSFTVPGDSWLSHFQL